MANEIISAVNGEVAVFGDQTIGTTYSSFNPETMEGKIKLYNAINAPDTKIADSINNVIQVRDVVISYVRLAGQKTDAAGRDLPPEKQTEDKDAFRVVLIDEEGVSHSATSQGLYNSLCILRKVFGDLHFEPCLPLLVKQIKTKNGNTLSLQIAAQ